MPEQMTIDEVIARKLLRDQKGALLKAITQIDKTDEGAADLLEGLVCWMDAIQDAAEAEGHPVEWLTETETEKEN